MKKVQTLKLKDASELNHRVFWNKVKYLGGWAEAWRVLTPGKTEQTLWLAWIKGRIRSWKGNHIHFMTLFSWKMQRACCIGQLINGRQSERGEKFSKHGEAIIWRRKEIRITLITAGTFTSKAWSQEASRLLSFSLKLLEIDSMKKESRRESSLRLLIRSKRGNQKRNSWRPW